MRAQRILIDGYNVIHASESLHRRASGDLEGARLELLALLEAYVRERSVRVTVVFDGRGALVDSESVLPGVLQVLYSAAGQTADEIIISTLREAENAKIYIVVTSDMADIGRAAKKLGCEVIGSKRFLERLQGASTRPSRELAARKPPKPDEYGDTEYWLRRFSAHDDKDED